MYLVVIAWFYVVVMAAVVEAMSPTGTVLGAFITFVLYGLLPLSIVVFILGTPGRKRAIHARALAERAAAAEAEAQKASSEALPSSAPSVVSAAPDADGKAPACAPTSAVAAVREEP